jgi:plasmid rolling circle replication initiator protein Rep
MWKSKAHKVIPKIVEEYPSHRWIFATFTVKNVDILDLRGTLIAMNLGFARMSKRKSFPATGWLRTTEVTKGKSTNAHPHFHCLLQVPASYFGKGYMRNEDWAKLWGDSMRLDYSPIVDIRAVKKESNPAFLVGEIIKYMTKESDLVEDKKWLLHLTEQIHKMRSIATGGVLKQYLKELEQEPDDLIGDGENDEAIEDFGRLFFAWRSRIRKYEMAD